MDYDANLQNFCPIAIVREVRQLDLQSYPSGNFVTTAQDERVSPDCLNAIVAWPILRIDKRTDPQFIGYWLGGLLEYVGELPSDAKADMRAAFLRLGNQPEHSHIYFAALRRHEIDIRDALADWIIPNWEFTTLPNRPEAHTWNYYVYLASFGDQNVYDKLASRAAQETSGNLALGLYDSLYELNTPQARAILEHHRDDERQIISPGGKRSPLGELIVLKLDLGIWK